MNKLFPLLAVVAIIVMLGTPIAIIIVAKQGTAPVKETESVAPKGVEITLPLIEVNVASDTVYRTMQLVPVLRVTNSNMEKFFHDSGPEYPYGRLRKIKAIIMDLVGSKVLKVLLSEKGKEDLSITIKKDLNNFLHTDANTKEEITDVYFTKYLAQ